MFRLSSIF